MKLLQDLENAQAKRKNLKPQVERRRRQRINQSLESLKNMLLQQQEATQRRVEKAEVLEHTVCFLQNTRRAEGEGQKHSFTDGFSSCLQRAAQFLGPEGKAALEASFAARFSLSDSNEARSCSSSLLLRESSRCILRLLVERSGHRLSLPAFTVSSCVQTGSPRSPVTPHQSHKAASLSSKLSPSQSQPTGQSVWRPWP